MKEDIVKLWLQDQGHSSSHSVPILLASTLLPFPVSSILWAAVRIAILESAPALVIASSCTVGVP